MGAKLHRNSQSSKVETSETKKHVPVLMDEVIDNLKIKGDGNYFDGTLGDGGHSEAIIVKLGTGKLISVDIDDKSVAFVTKNSTYAKLDNWVIERGNYVDVQEICRRNGVDKLDGFLLDLGLSSRQIADRSRGFSFYGGSMVETIDMRMDDRLQVKAIDLLMALTKAELIQLFTKYGEEMHAERIATKIVTARKQGKLRNTLDLVGLIKDATPRVYDRGRKHPARRVFQALRIAINDEINNVRKGLASAWELVKSGGRVVVITYHSLEDKEVTKFIDNVFDCAKLITPVPIAPSIEELSKNRRARSAKLYVIEKE